MHYDHGPSICHDRYTISGQCKVMHNCLCLFFWSTAIEINSVSSEFLYYTEKNTSLTNLLTFLRTFPSVLVFHGHLQLSPSIAMELCCVAGTLLAFVMMIFRAMRCTLWFAVLWFLYLSVYKVCIHVLHSRACVHVHVCVGGGAVGMGAGVREKEREREQIKNSSGMAIVSGTDCICNDWFSTPMFIVELLLILVDQFWDSSHHRRTKPDTEWPQVLGSIDLLTRGQLQRWWDHSLPYEASGWGAFRCTLFHPFQSFTCTWFSIFPYNGLTYSIHATRCQCHCFMLEVIARIWWSICWQQQYAVMRPFILPLVIQMFAWFNCWDNNLTL